MKQSPEVYEDIIKYIKSFATGFNVLKNIFRFLAQLSNCEWLESSIIKH